MIDPEAHDSHGELIESIKQTGDVLNLTAKTVENCLDTMVPDHNVDPEAHPNLRAIIDESDWAKTNKAMLDDFLKKHDLNTQAHLPIREYLEETISNAKVSIANAIEEHNQRPDAHDPLKRSLQKLIDDHNASVDSHPHIAALVEAFKSRKIDYMLPIVVTGSLADGDLTITMTEATVSAAGSVMKATDEEVVNGVDDKKYITPKQFYNRTKDLEGVPIGAIVGFDGYPSDIPAGWAICDGTNNTPDLRDRFIIGAGGAYALGAIGGAVSVTAAVSIGATTLTLDQIPSHSHGVPFGARGGSYPWGTFGTNGWGSTSTDYDNTWAMSSWSGGNGSHTHAASSVKINTLPPYYALYFIKKVS